MLPLPPGGSLSVPIYGLAPQATSHARATVYANDGSALDGLDVTVTTGDVPLTIPPVDVTVNSGTTSGYLLLSEAVLPDSDAWAMIVDRDGRLLWYRNQAPSSYRGVDFQRQPNGHLTVYQSVGFQFEDIDTSLNVVKRWTAPASAYGADGHELLALPNGNALVIGVEGHVEDTRPYVDGGAADALVMHNSVNEVTPDGGTVFRWSTHPEITISETRDFTVPVEGYGIDTVHMNALAIAPDGNILASGRQLDALLKIDRQKGKLLWRLGGNKSDFTFVGDPLNGFVHQHDARFLPNGEVLLFDNGNRRVPERSRVVQYRLDENAKTATMTWEFRHVPDLDSQLAGSARRLANGNTVIDYAEHGIICEVDANAKVQWEADLGGMTVYRALPVESLY
jgi:hypothetical protein